MKSPEIRFAELRADVDRRILEGVAMPYNEIATLPWGRERFEPGAFGPVADIRIALNRFHVRAAPIARTGGFGLLLEDDADALRMQAVLPETRLANEVLSEVRAGLLRSLSVEFSALKERVDAGVRVVQTAMLTGLSVVDDGAYSSATIQARMAQHAPRRRRIWL